MPRWENNPANVNLRTIYEPMEDVELVIDKLSTVESDKKDEDGKLTFWGINATLKFSRAVTQEGKDLKGKTYNTSFNLGNTEYGEGFAKQFQMAVYGYSNNRDGVERFDRWAEGIDWSVDTEAKTFGEGWQGMIGRTVRAKFDVKPDKNGELRQQVTWKPLA